MAGPCQEIVTHEKVQIIHAFTLRSKPSATNILIPGFLHSKSEWFESKDKNQKIRIIVSYANGFSHNSNFLCQFPIEVSVQNEVDHQARYFKVIRSSPNLVPRICEGNGYRLAHTWYLKTKPKPGEAFFFDVEVCLPGAKQIQQALTPEKEDLEYQVGTSDGQVLNQLVIEKLEMIDETCVTFKSNDNSYPINKLLLVSRSSVFKTMLNNIETKESQMNEINFDHYDEDVVELFVKFLKTLRIAKKEVESHGVVLYQIGEMYNVPDLSSICAKSLCYGLKLDNFVEIAVMASLHQNKVLLSAASSFFMNYREQIKELPEWKEMRKNHPTLGLDLLEAF